MNSLLRNVLTFLLAAFIGGAVNFAIVSIGFDQIATPEGFDFEKPNTFALLEPIHFILPFAAHALGTLVGAFLVSKFAVSHHKKLAMGVGFFFLVGGILASLSIPAPIWFIVLDLGMAYIPMALLGWIIGGKR